MHSHHATGREARTGDRRRRQPRSTLGRRATVSPPTIPGVTCPATGLGSRRQLKQATVTAIEVREGRHKRPTHRQVAGRSIFATAKRLAGPLGPMAALLISRPASTAGLRGLTSGRLISGVDKRRVNTVVATVARLACFSGTASV